MVYFYVCKTKGAHGRLDNWRDWNLPRLLRIRADERSYAVETMESLHLRAVRFLVAQMLGVLVFVSSLCLATGCRNRESPHRVLERVAGLSFAESATIERSSFDQRLQDSTLVWSLKHEPKNVSSVLKQMGFGLADDSDLTFASQQVKALLGLKPDELANLSLYRARLNDRDLYWLIDRDMKRSFLLILSY